ncbi:EscU/YscU/HrcU family type III secretion system export apparatus switch protein, partial [Yersinia pestis]|uniref:EscU/YscU/HrcU family type III secretion system export apparatus switch protein n=1 Tax=Yersinia pestis TaxID=632 RepID=UPI001C48EB68
IVIEKGHDEQAAMIVSLPEQSGIPLVENIALARALHRDEPSGDPIPEQFFEPVAALLRMALVLDYQPSSDDPPR